jgi:hypothetical protein
MAIRSSERRRSEDKNSLMFVLEVSCKPGPLQKIKASGTLRQLLSFMGHPPHPKSSERACHLATHRHRSQGTYHGIYQRSGSIAEGCQFLQKQIKPKRLLISLLYSRSAGRRRLSSCETHHNSKGSLLVDFRDFDRFFSMSHGESARGPVRFKSIPSSAFNGRKRPPHF